MAPRREGARGGGRRRGLGRRGAEPAAPPLPSPALPPVPGWPRQPAGPVAPLPVRASGRSCVPALAVLCSIAVLSLRKQRTNSVGRHTGGFAQTP